MTQYERSLLEAAGPHLHLLELSSDPQLMSHVEALGDSDTERSAAAAKLTHANNLEDQFNRTLVEYSKAYKEFSEATLEDIRARNTGAYRNTVVDVGDGSYVYVNDHGVTHRYSAATWSSKDKSCPADSKRVSRSVVGGMPTGHPMNPGEPCGVSGKNVRNTDSGETAWVDVEGVKHVYSEKAWSDKSKSCSGDVVKLAKKAYEAIPSGAPMRPTQDCSQGNIDPRVWQRLQKLNHRLVYLAGRLAASLGDLNVRDASLQKKLDDYQAKISAHVTALGEDQASSPLNTGDMQNARARAESTRVLARTRWYHYMVWILTASVVVALTSRALGTKDPGAATTLIALVALIVIMYNVVRWLYDRVVG